MRNCITVLPMTRNALFLFLCVAFCGVLVLTSCGESNSSVALHAMTPAEHFAEARICHDNQEDLALAIWHHQQFLLDADEEPELAPIAKIEYEQCLKEFLSGMNISQNHSSTIQDKEEQLRLLKLRNAELESWISRLNTENLSLRQALLKAQESTK